LGVLIGSLNSEYPWIFIVLGRDSKWLLVPCQFQKMILVVNEAAAPKNTKKETKFGLSVFTGW